MEDRLRQVETEVAVISSKLDGHIKEYHLERQEMNHKLDKLSDQQVEIRISLAKQITKMAAIVSAITIIASAIGPAAVDFIKGTFGG